MPFPSRRSTLAAAAAFLLGALPSFSRADEGGLALMVLAVPKDSASQKAAATAGFLARGVFARNPRYQLLDLETFLDQAQESPGRAPITRALASLEKGGHALDENELDTAISALNDAVVAFEQGAAYLTDVKPYMDALLRLGATYALNADNKSATDSFRRALLLDRTASLPNLPNQAKKAFEDAGRKVDEAERVSISVFSTPSAAEVYVDGVFRGATPQVIDRLPTGPHLIRVLRPGMRAAGRSYKVAAADDTVQFTLKPTARAAELENITNRIHNDVTTGQGPVLNELARFAKVDQIYVMGVQSTATDVRASAVLVDGTGHPLSQGERTFSGDRFRAELDGWIEQGFRTGQAGTEKAAQKDISTQTSSNFAAPKGGGGSPGLGKIIGGILLIPPFPLTLVVAFVALLLTALVWWLWATFPIPVIRDGGVVPFNFSQRDTNYRVLMAVLGIIFPVVTTLLLLVATASMAGGIALIVWGNSEKRTMDAIMAAGGSGGGGEGGGLSHLNAPRPTVAEEP